MIRFLAKNINLFSQTSLKPPPPKCLVLHPVSFPNKGPMIEHYLAEEAIGLISSLNWQVVEGPFWKQSKLNKKQLFKDLPANSVYMEPEYGSEIKDGTYVNSSLGKGVYYKDGIIFDEDQSESDGDLHKEWKDKILRENLASSSLIKCKKITQKLFFTKGKIQKIIAHLISSQASCLFVNAQLKPGQVRNLKKVIEARLNNKNLPRGYSIGMGDQNSETQFQSTEDYDQEKQKSPRRQKAKPAKKIQVFDRFSIILQIFAQRTTSKLAKLQIELSYLSYLKTRLVRDGSTYSSNLNFFSGNLLNTQEINLEIISAKQRRALGIMSGQGESQLQIERRNIKNKQAKIRRQIEEQAKLRANRKQKDKKRNSEVPVIALVGYTNVGKSAFMNYVMGKTEVQSKDLLFQTLKTTSRFITLPSGRKAALLDTIGFITDLPIEMIDAFKATLEDIAHADVVLHLKDISHPQNQLQKSSVLKILKQLNFEEQFYREKMVEVWNKVDLLAEQGLEEQDLGDDHFKISCTTGTNVNKLLTHIEQILKKTKGLEMRTIEYSFKRHHKVIDWLKFNANISYGLNEQHNYESSPQFPEGSVKIHLEINEATHSKLMKFLDELEGKTRQKNKQNKGMPPAEGW